MAYKEKCIQHFFKSKRLTICKVLVSGSHNLKENASSSRLRDNYKFILIISIGVVVPWGGGILF